MGYPQVQPTASVVDDNDEVEKGHGRPRQKSVQQEYEEYGHQAYDNYNNQPSDRRGIAADIQRFIIIVFVAFGLAASICAFIALGLSIGPNDTDYYLDDRIDNLEQLVISNLVDPCYEEDYSCIIRRVALYKEYPLNDPWINYLIENPPKTPAILDKILQEILSH